MFNIIIYVMKTKRSLLIYNKAIGYVGFKCYTFMSKSYLY